MKNILAMLGFGRRGVILAYHSIGKNGLSFAVSLEEFSHQMQHLKQKKYQVIALSEMCSRLEEGRSVRRCVAITFQDGYEDFFKNAFPILKRNNFPATVFLAAGKLGTEVRSLQGKDVLKIMTAGDVKRASTTNGLIEFMPQVAMRPTSSLVSLPEVIKKINESRSTLEALTGKPADIVSFPKGARTHEIADYLRKSGVWLGAVDSHHGYIETESDRFLLKRILIEASTSFAAFKKLLP